MRRLLSFFFAVAFVDFLIACGGGGGGSSNKSLLGSQPKVRVAISGVTAPDGTKLKAYAFLHNTNFYPPDSMAHGASNISGGAGAASLAPPLRDGTFDVYSYLDVNPQDGDRPMPGDWVTGPKQILVSGESGTLELGPADFVPVNVQVDVAYGDPGGEGKEVRVRAGTPTTPCKSTTTIEAFGVITSGHALMGLAGLPDGTYSICGVINLDPATSVTGLPGGTDLVTAKGTGLTVAGGTGSVVLQGADFHLVPKLPINLPSMTDGKQVTVMIADTVTMLPLAFGLGSFSGGSASVPLLFWVLDGTWMAVAMIDMDGSGPTGITLGDMMGVRPVNITGAAATFFPPPLIPPTAMGPTDFLTVNVLAHIQVSGQDGKRVYLGVYPFPQGIPCSGAPLTQGLPTNLSSGTATIPLGGLPDGNYGACVLVDVDGSGSTPNSGDISAYHPFTVSGNTEFTVTQAEFITVP